MDGSLLKRSDISVLSLMVLFSVKVVALLRMMLGRRSSWDLNSQGFVPLHDDLISTEFSVTDDWILDHKVWFLHTRQSSSKTQFFYLPSGIILNTSMAHLHRGIQNKIGARI
jgi:hypothetical protein